MSCRRDYQIGESQLSLSDQVQDRYNLLRSAHGDKIDFARVRDWVYADHREKYKCNCMPPPDCVPPTC